MSTSRVWLSGLRSSVENNRKTTENNRKNSIGLENNRKTTEKQQETTTNNDASLRKSRGRFEAPLSRKKTSNHTHFERYVEVEIPRLQFALAAIPRFRA